MAPIVPFITDYVWGILRAGEGPDSVHLATWPVADPDLVDQQLSAQMALVRRVVELGRSARAGASLGIRQPLPQALVGASGFAGLPEDLRDQIAAELNVRAVEPLSTVASPAAASWPASVPGSTAVIAAATAWVRLPKRRPSVRKVGFTT